MAVLPKYFLGSAAGTASSTTIPIATINQADLGDLIVVRAACDNLSATTPTFTCVDLAGNTYTTVVQKAHNATAGAGAAVAIMVTKVTVALPAASTITVVLSAAVAAKAAYAETFTDCGVTVRASNSFSQSAASQSGSGAVTPAVGDLVLGVAAVETSAAITGDPDTVGGSWSTMRAQLANPGTTAASMTVAGQWKIPNVTASQTYGVSWTGVTDYAGAAVVLVPEVYVPPVPLDPDHVKIGDLIYCVPPHGVAVHVDVITPTQTIDVTDLIMRATWQQGGAYDAGGSPWYNPTPNPCELELAVTDPKWDPTTIGAYDLTPLATIVKVYLAEKATNPTVSWSAQVRFYGPLLTRTYQPQPGGGPARVTLSAIDALTNLGDALGVERPEEAPWQRLAALASTVKDLDYAFTAGGYLDTPQLGRYHPDAGQTRLEVMVDAAMAGGCALMFQPSAIDAPVGNKTIVYPRQQGRLGDAAESGTWLASVDPDRGMVLGSFGGSPAQGANTRTACLTDIVLARQDAGFRTRIRSARTIAPWTIQTYLAGPVAALPAGTHNWQSGQFNARPGDRLEMVVTANEPISWTTNPPATYRFYTNPFAVPAQQPVHFQEQPISSPDGWPGTTPLLRYTFEVPPTYAGWFAMGRYLVVASGTLKIPASYTETVSRLGGSGVEIETVFAGAETIYGERAVTGWRSPIAAQGDLAVWNDRALRWVIAPTLYPRLLRVASTAGHPSPGAQQWAVQAYAGHRIAVRHLPAGADPVLPTLTSWIVNMSTTLTQTECTVDVECGPVTTGVA